MSDSCPCCGCNLWETQILDGSEGVYCSDCGCKKEEFAEQEEEFAEQEESFYNMNCDCCPYTEWCQPSDPKEGETEEQEHHCDCYCDSDSENDLDLGVGDVVELKSGSPNMTVEELDPLTGYCDCIWFDGQEIKKLKDIHLSCLSCLVKANKKEE
jgi:uncharacterized protein YodC (DUF2158 family)